MPFMDLRWGRGTAVLTIDADIDVALLGGYNRCCAS